MRIHPIKLFKKYSLMDKTRDSEYKISITGYSKSGISNFTDVFTD